MRPRFVFSHNSVAQKSGQGTAGMTSSHSTVLGASGRMAHVSWHGSFTRMLVPRCVFSSPRASPCGLSHQQGGLDFLQVAQGSKSIKSAILSPGSEALEQSSCHSPLVRAVMSLAQIQWAEAWTPQLTQGMQSLMVAN